MKFPKNLYAIQDIKYTVLVCTSMYYYIFFQYFGTITRTSTNTFEFSNYQVQIQVQAHILAPNPVKVSLSWPSYLLRTVNTTHLFSIFPTFHPPPTPFPPNTHTASPPPSHSPARCVTRNLPTSIVYRDTWSPTKSPMSCEGSSVTSVGKPSSLSITSK